MPIIIAFFEDRFPLRTPSRVIFFTTATIAQSGIQHIYRTASVGSDFWQRRKDDLLQETTVILFRSEQCSTVKGLIPSSEV
jgi:hypothetical protein